MTWPAALPEQRNAGRLKPPPKSLAGALCLELREYENAHKWANKSLHRQKLLAGLEAMRQWAQAMVRCRYVNATNPTPAPECRDQP